MRESRNASRERAEGEWRAFAGHSGLPSRVARPTAFVRQSVAGTCAQPFVVAGEETYITCTAGYTLYPEDATDPAGLLQRAESAMFDARRAGPGTVMRFDGDPARRLGPLLRLENALRHAVQHGELFLLYQPQIDLASGEVACSEALVRWQHPQLGTLTPDKFIPCSPTRPACPGVGSWVLGERRVRRESGRRRRYARHGGRERPRPCSSTPAFRDRG